MKVGTDSGPANYDSKEAIAVGGTTPNAPQNAQPNLFNIQYFDAAGVANYSPFLGSSDPFPGLSDYSAPGTGEHGYWFQYGTQIPGYSTTFPGDNASHVNIVVGRIQWGGGAGGTDIVSFYVFHDKDKLSEVDFNAGALSWDTGYVSAKSTFNYLSIGGGRYFVDELRIATSFSAFVERSARRRRKRTRAFFSYYIDKGTIPYGDHRPAVNCHDDNGKNGEAAIVFDLQGLKAGSQFFSKLVTASVSDRECGHTGNTFS